MKVPFRFTNTLTRAQEELKPLSPPEVSIYTCGPTVYGTAHIGNFRTFIFEDVMVKALRQAGYAPKRVMNITDVGHLTSDADEGEDKLQVGARRDGTTAWEVAKRYEAEFLADMARLNLEIPKTLVRATDTIPEQIAFITELEAKGFTYTTSDGVYFDSSKVPTYGRLARLDLAGLQEGARIEAGEKHHKTDFALWKFSPQGVARDMEWESPWGKGFPGWHIECSAIIRKTLGDQIDIHCGGADHIPVHHTNEIAQSESLTSQALAQIWLHGEFLLVDGGKMSKSLGNVHTLQDIAAKGIDPLAFRLFTFSAGYRAQLNFTWEALQGSAQQLKRLRQHAQAPEATPTERLEPYKEQFTQALVDDLNMSAALAVVWEALGTDLTPGEKRAFLLYADEVLCLNLGAEPEGLPENIKALLEQRHAARTAGNWAESDSLRSDIANQGYIVKDTPQGQETERKAY